MDKESRYLLQKIDCNCNDCFFMTRDFDKFKESLSSHKRWDEDHFNMQRRKMLENVDEWKEKARKARKKGQEGKMKECMRKYEYLKNEVKKMNFVFDKSSSAINYGRCEKFEKDVSFIPNCAQLDTQECFEHRIDHMDEGARNKRLEIIL